MNKTRCCIGELAMTAASDQISRRPCASRFWSPGAGLAGSLAAAVATGERRDPRPSRRCNPTRCARLVLVAAGAALVLIATLHGCATLSEADCLSIDWAVKGEADGQQGRPVSELNRYRKQCAAYGVVPESQPYLEARERGLAVYCTHDNGYHEGRQGAPHNLVCPVALEPGFRGGYELGHAVHVSLTDLRNSSASIRANRDTIETLRSDISAREEALRSDDLDEAERQQKRDAIDSDNGRIKQLERDIVGLTGDLAFSIARYQQAVEAARRVGHDEPMESELLEGLLRLAR